MVNPNDIVDRLASAAGRRVGNSADGRYVQLPRVCCGVYDAQSDGLKVTAFASGKLGVWCHQAPLTDGARKFSALRGWYPRVLGGRDRHL